MFIDDQFTNETLIANTIRKISNDAFVFIMEDGNFNLIYNICLVKGLEIFNFISLNNITTPFDIIIVFGSTNIDLQNYSKIPIINIMTQNAEPPPSDNQLNEISAKSDFGRVRSFQFIDESNPDLFLDKCCKTFIPDEQQSTIRSEETSDSNPRSFINSQEVWNTAVSDTHRTDCVQLQDQLDGKNAKFMQVMLIEAKRLGFRKKKEEFKKQIKKSSSASSLPVVIRPAKLPKSQSNVKDRLLVGAERSSDRPPSNKIVPQKDKSPKTVPCKVSCIATCLASTKKKGAPCTNSALPGTNYCGIPSHKKLGITGST